MAEKDPERLTNTLRWTARAITIFALGFTLIGPLIGGIIEAQTEGWAVVTETAGVLLIVIGLIGLAGLIVSWWWQWLAGILVILTTTGMAIHISVYAGRNHVLVWVATGLPYLIAGVLFLLSWRLSRKTT